MNTPATIRTTLIAAALSLCVNVQAQPVAASVRQPNGPDTPCIALPSGFSKPAVIAATPPKDLWNGWTYGKQIMVEATPLSALMDQPVNLRVSGLQPREPVTLRASMTGYRHHTFLSQATFVADDHGNVDVARQAPKFGSYSGVHAMGLVWSMQPQAVKNPKATFYGPPGDTFPVKLDVLAENRVLASVTLNRRLLAAGVTKTGVNADGLVGELYTPVSPGPHPAVLVLGGSEGGLYPQVNEAALLASHGYVALGLAYFQGFTGAGNEVLAPLPKTLANIPLEYFAKAAQWLKRQPGVDRHRVAIMGWSKGAEAALIAASEFPDDFQAVIAFMPSSVVWMGLNFGGTPSSSWTLRGKPLPWLNFVPADFAQFASGKPVAFLDGYRTALDETSRAAKAAIPVERIRGPLLLISGSDDQVWPSPLMSRQIVQRRAARHASYRDVSLCYAGAGHAILPPWRPTNASAGGPVLLGGNPVAYAFADQDAWNKLLAFLSNAMPTSKAVAP